MELRFVFSRDARYLPGLMQSIKDGEVVGVLDGRKVAGGKGTLDEITQMANGRPELLSVWQRRHPRPIRVFFARYNKVRDGRHQPTDQPLTRDVHVAGVEGRLGLLPPWQTVCQYTSYSRRHKPSADQGQAGASYVAFTDFEYLRASP